ncbi:MULTISPECIES: SGNH/GDSL hydrolase family protein [Pseudoxanthomonas]|jgi:acyl-CoA thioesterase-1|uniref:Capsular biosynthesis protein n=1 Tax=Pseudoxanthomonas winnipegensis TaxID=2480810 RepID=A0A4Q8L808_9GAMM|nr:MULTISPECIES: SGNH/GDSL hydrolase family protein [Pseudoxanthomonas]TAA23746.1 capsular biosynthesis protein [Pseudoxanthomonas winnipegensis]TMN17883.1 capsular biosynthesis protein [Pseudoxanthomonas sp. X-1]UAY76435.1 SGNH/GDSL hydrolase family protein [Pseudoxanthomonas sp. X-1]
MLKCSWPRVGLPVLLLIAATAGDAAAQTPSAEQVQAMQRQLADWPQLARYRDENAALAAPAPGQRRVVFFGDSITEGWGKTGSETFFPGKPYVNRGISGQTTPQMLVRFRQDVIDLKPAVVVILAGTNDLAGNTGPATPQMIQDNLASMAQLARANGIAVVLASVLPASDYPWKTGLQPAPKIRALNDWIRQYAQRTGAVYLDYYGALDNGQGGLDAKVSGDGVHPNAAGYAVMAPLALAAVERALRQAR